MRLWVWQGYDVHCWIQSYSGCFLLHVPPDLSSPPPVTSHAHPGPSEHHANYIDPTDRELSLRGGIGLGRCQAVVSPLEGALGSELVTGEAVLFVVVTGRIACLHR